MVPVKKVIFLDIDGVMVTRSSVRRRDVINGQYHSSADPRCVKNLNWLIDKTKAKIVISSAWRYIGLQEMRIILQFWGVDADVIDVTPRSHELTQKRYNSKEWKAITDPKRGDEIAWWISRNQPEAFVIIDDDADMCSLLPYLVQTKFKFGLTKERAEAAVKILTGDAARCVNCGGIDHCQPGCQAGDPYP